MSALSDSSSHVYNDTSKVKVPYLVRLVPVCSSGLPKGGKEEREVVAEGEEGGCEERGVAPTCTPLHP